MVESNHPTLQEEKDIANELKIIGNINNKDFEVDEICKNNETFSEISDKSRKIIRFLEPSKSQSNLSDSEIKKNSGSTTLNTSLDEIKNEYMVNSTNYLKFQKRTESVSSDGNKKSHDSLNTSSSEEEDRKMFIKGKKRRKYDIDYSGYKRSKSSLGIKKCFPFPVVKEEKEEEADQESKYNEKFKALNLKILKEGHDKSEEAYLDHRNKIMTTARSTKCLSLDPVLEEKEEIDYNQNKFPHFKKLKFVVDAEEDIRFGVSSANHHHYNLGNIDDAIEEDNRENDLELEYKRNKYHTLNIKKIPDFIYGSEGNKSGIVESKSYIIEEIKEEFDEVLDEIFNSKCKF